MGGLARETKKSKRAIADKVRSLPAGKLDCRDCAQTKLIRAAFFVANSTYGIYFLSIFVLRRGDLREVPCVMCRDCVPKECSYEQRFLMPARLLSICMLRQGDHREVVCIALSPTTGNVSSSCA